MNNEKMNKTQEEIKLREEEIANLDKTIDGLYYDLNGGYDDDYDYGEEQERPEE